MSSSLASKDEASSSQLGDEESSVDGKRIIPYRRSELRIQKQGGKQTASAIFCATRKTTSTSATGGGGAEPSISPRKSSRDGPGGGASRALIRDSFSIAPSDVSVTFSAANDSDFSDNYSVVSDVSDLSVMSLHNPPGLGVGHSSAASVVLPGVHGAGASADKGAAEQRRRDKVRQMSRRLALLQSEKDVFSRRASVSSVQKAQLARLQEANFALQRENVNLKSQVELLQQHQRTAAAEAVLLGAGVGEARSEAEALQRAVATTADEGWLGRHRAQLKSTQDELVGLQSELLRKDLELEAARKTVGELKDRVDDLQKEKASMRMRLDEMKEGSATVWSHASSVQTKVQTLEEDLKSAVESKEWHQQQLCAAKESRSKAQAELMEARRESSSRAETAARLKGELEASRDELAREKEGFSQKLRKIEQEMAEQESQMDQIQAEKDAAIADLTERLAAFEGDARSVHLLSENVQGMEASLGEVRERLELKERDMEEQEGEKARLEEKVASLQNNVSELRDKIAIAEASLKEKEEKQMELQKSRETIFAEKEKAEKELEDIKCQSEESHRKINLENELLKVQVDTLSKKLAGSSTKIAELSEMVDSTDEKRKEQSASLSNANLEVASLRAKLQSAEEQWDGLKVQLKQRVEENNKHKEENVELVKQLKEETERCAKYKDEVTLLSDRVKELERRSPSPDLNGEIMELRREVIRLEQLENECADLRQKVEELEESRAVLGEKLMEAEKEYEEKVEKLREGLSQRDGIIDGLRRDIEAVEGDLGETKKMLDAGAAERERVDSEKARRAEDLEEATAELERVRKKLAEQETAVDELVEQVCNLREEGESMSSQLEKTSQRAEAAEHENQRLRMSLEEEVAAGEECRDLQAQKLARMESFTAEYEREVEELSAAKGRLQEQIIALEDANGRLQGESVLNESLREQVQQLQRDLKGDTTLRQELVRSIEAAKSDLGKEVTALESSLAEEKKERARAEARASLLVQEAMEIKEKLDDTRKEVDRLEALLRRAKEDSRAEERRVEVNDGEKRKQRELEHLLEEKGRSISSLEDHVGTLKFSLQQREAELEEARSLLRLGIERQEAAAERAREAHEVLRLELAEQRRASESLAEERSNYRAQVQQMNLALRNGLEHIRQLRSKASCPGSPSTSASSRSIEDPFGMMADVPPPPGLAPPPARNLSNLQACLASLKAEMALLQTRLAPPPDDRSISSASALDFLPSSAGSVLRGSVGDLDSSKEDQMN